VRLTTEVSSLDDTGLASVRSAIGALQNSTADGDVLVLANNSTNSGMYLVIDSDGDGQIAAGEIRLLGIFRSNATATFTDVTVG
jgi:hypothetical protein